MNMDKINNNNKEFNNAELTIRNNIIESYDYIIQIKNISCAWIGYLNKKPINVGAVILFTFLGLLSLALFPFLNLISVGLSAVFFLGLFLLVYRNNRQKRYFSLVIELNCRKQYSFISTNRDFLKNVLQVLRNIMIDDELSNNITYNLNFGSGNISTTNTGNIKNEGVQTTCQ